MAPRAFIEKEGERRSWDAGQGGRRQVGSRARWEPEAVWSPQELGEPGRMVLTPAAGTEVTDKPVGLAACIVSGEQHPLPGALVTRA